MLTLALDTTTRSGSVAVVDGDALLAVVEGDAARTHGERLPGEMRRALIAAGRDPRDVELLAVASGPGAFTGLRIGLAAAQGLAMVLGCPVVGVSALDALALAAFSSAADRHVAAWMDAERGEVFAAFYPATEARAAVPRALDLPIVDGPDAVLGQIGAQLAETVFIGTGAARYAAAIAGAGADASAVRETPRALAPFIARIGGQLAARGQAGPPHALQPLYVRRPDAELERARKASR